MCVCIYKEKTTLIYPKINKKTFKKTSLNKYHNNKEINATSFVKHSKPLFYTYKHKYIYIKKLKDNKRRPLRTYFWIIKVYLEQLLFPLFFLSFLI